MLNSSTQHATGSSMWLSQISSLMTQRQPVDDDPPKTTHGNAAKAITAERASRARLVAERDQRILDAVRACGEADRYQVAELTGIKPMTAGTYCRDLVIAGKLAASKVGLRNYWRIRGDA